MSIRGLRVAVLGVDGAGKSTVIDAVGRSLTNLGFTLHVKHLRPGLLPPLAALKPGGRPEATANLNPHAAPPSGTLGSIVRLLYLMLDYVLGHHFVIRRCMDDRAAIVIFDRYAYDLALDPQRFRIHLPSWVVRSATRLAPRPDVVICLHGEPSTVASRKNELPLNEVRRQVEAIRAFASREARAVLISTTDHDVSAVRDLVVERVLAVFARHTSSGSDAPPAAPPEYRFGWRCLLSDSARQENTFVIGLTRTDEQWWRQDVSTMGSRADVGAPRGCVAVATKLNMDPLLQRLRAAAPEWICARGSGDTIRSLGKKLSAYAEQREYALLPPGNPRVIVPLSSPAVVHAGLKLHRPGRWWIRLALGAAALLARAGVHALVRREVLLIAAAHPHVLQDAEHETALYLGTPDAGRKTVLLHFSSTGRPLFISKLAESPGAVIKLQQECDALRRLAGTTLADRIPRPISFESSGQRAVLKQEYRMRRHAAPWTMRRAVLAFLAELGQLDQWEMPLDEWLEVHRAKLGNTALASRIRTLAGDGAVVSLCRGHGDFAPWNCCWTGEGLFVYDWEESHGSSLALADAFYFVIAPALHVTHLRASARRTLNKAVALGQEVARLGGFRGLDVRLHMALWLLTASEWTGLHSQLLTELERSWT